MAALSAGMLCHPGLFVASRAHCVNEYLLHWPYGRGWWVACAANCRVVVGTRETLRAAPMTALTSRSLYSHLPMPSNTDAGRMRNGGSHADGCIHWGATSCEGTEGSSRGGSSEDKTKIFYNIPTTPSPKAAAPKGAATKPAALIQAFEDNSGRFCRTLRRNSSIGGPRAARRCSCRHTWMAIAVS